MNSLDIGIMRGSARSCSPIAMNGDSLPAAQLLPLASSCQAGTPPIGSKMSKRPRGARPAGTNYWTKTLHIPDSLRRAHPAGENRRKFFRHPTGAAILYHEYPEGRHAAGALRARARHRVRLRFRRIAGRFSIYGGKSWQSRRSARTKASTVSDNASTVHPADQGGQVLMSADTAAASAAHRPLESSWFMRNVIERTAVVSPEEESMGGALCSRSPRRRRCLCASFGARPRAMSADIRQRRSARPATTCFPRTGPPGADAIKNNLLAFHLPTCCCNQAGLPITHWPPSRQDAHGLQAPIDPRTSDAILDYLVSRQEIGNPTLPRSPQSPGSLLITPLTRIRAAATDHAGVRRIAFHCHPHPPP